MQPLYGLLCGYAHSDSLSSLQIYQAKSREEQTELAQSALHFLKVIVSKMIASYTDKFPEARRALASDVHAARLAKDYASEVAKTE